MFDLLPKPPPTSGAIQRSWPADRPSTMPTKTWVMCGICVDDQTVISAADSSHSATTPRVSSGAPV